MHFSEDLREHGVTITSIDLAFGRHLRGGETVQLARESILLPFRWFFSFQEGRILDWEEQELDSGNESLGKIS